MEASLQTNPLPMLPPPRPYRRQPLIRSSSRASPSSRCGEVAGAKTAECAAICCCLPFAVIDLLVLTAVKLPAGVYRNLMRRRRRRRRVRLRMKRAGMEGEWGGGAREETEGAVMMMRRSPSEVVKEREEEMWARFHGAGFWRSHSQRDTI